MEMRNERINKSPYVHSNHVGLYIALYLVDRGISIKQASKASGISRGIFKRILAGDYNMGLKSFFQMSDFMASRSVYDSKFFMNRLKQEIEKGALNE